MPNIDVSNDVEVTGLRKQFPGERQALEVIDDLTFSVGQGQLIAIIGPSGCGKSTLLRILSGAVEPTSGKLYVEPERSKRSASIEQSPALFPWRTALQNASIGAEIRRGTLSKALSRRICESFEAFGLQGFEKSFPHELSGGMQQRVAIIRALESEPQMLYCDEPFSAIDFVTRLSLNGKFKKISRTLGCTTLFVTHNIEEAIFLGDRILVLSQRPCRIIDDFSPQLSRSPEDPVKCRLSPEFPDYFNRIWEKLKP